MSDLACRIDVWLWRARFAKTRTLAATMVEKGAVRLTHHGQQVRLDKASRSVHPGDRLVFALGGRLFDLEVLALRTARSSGRGPRPVRAYC